MIFEDGEQTRDFIHVSDIVQANLLALEKDTADYQSLNVGTGRPTSVREVAWLLTAGLGKDLQPEVVLAVSRRRHPSLLRRHLARASFWLRTQNDFGRRYSGITRLGA